MSSHEPFSVHLWWDHNIDRDKSDLRRWCNERDPGALVAKEGCALQTYVCRPISNSGAIRMLRKLDYQSQLEWAFAYSVMEGRNVWLRDGRQGVDVRPPAFDERANEINEHGDLPEDGRLLWDVQNLFDTFDPTTVEEVGEVVRARAFLVPGRKPSYVLPPLSLQLLLETEDLHAALGPSGDSNGGTGTGLSSDPQNAKTDSSGGTGDATAMASATDSPLVKAIRKWAASGT